MPLVLQKSLIMLGRFSSAQGSLILVASKPYAFRSTSEQVLNSISARESSDFFIDVL